MIRRKWFSTVAAMLVLTLSLAACGGTSNSGASGTSAAAETASTQDAAQAASTEAEAADTTEAASTEDAADAASTAEEVVETASGGHVENLVVGTTQPNDTFNLATQTAAFGRMNYNCLANADFVYQDKNNEMKPYFLKSFEFSEGGKVLTCVMPTDKVWHDGNPVTVEDLKFTFEYKRDVMKAQTLQNLESVEIEGDDTVVLTFSSPDAYPFLLNGCGNNNCILPKHIWENITEYSDYRGEDAAIGCGPYKLVDYDVDAGISHYEAVPQNAYLGELTVDAITVRSYSSMDTCLMAMINGEIDVMFNYSSPVNVTLLDLLNGVDNIDLGESDFAGNYQVTFGMEEGRPYQDYALREATVKSLDWDLLLQVINGDYGQLPGSGIITPSCMGFDDSLWKMYRDLDEAKQILADAGYEDANGDGYLDKPDGSELTVSIVPQFHRTNMELHTRIADIIAASLEELGIQSTIDQRASTSSEVWESIVIDGDYDIFIGYTTSGMAKHSTAFRYFAAVDRNGNDDSSVWIWGTNHDKEFNDTVWELTYAIDEETFLRDIHRLQEMASEQLFAFALCWEKAFFPYRTDKYQGFDNWPSWGVVNNETFYRITTK